MVKIGPPGPKMNTLDIDPRLAYADTSSETWRIIRFFLEELRPVEIAGLEPEDRSCPICAEDYKIDFHRPVRLPCNHCYGESCITKWLSPFIPWSKYAGLTKKILQNHPGANTCPSCRQVFFPRQQAIDCLPQIELRIKFWDWAYAQAGIALSEREHQAREGLLRYIDGCSARGLDEYYPSELVRPGSESRKFPPWALFRFLKTVTALNSRRNLTPIQKQLTRRLQYMSERLNGGYMRWRRDDQGILSFVYTGVVETEEVKADEETEEPIEGDTEEMRFFRAMFR
ncbi:hypothetical protein MMC29_003888 [Sticta canariensis]|nr:hypothetical protein [Sticta canariensis]